VAADNQDPTDLEEMWLSKGAPPFAAQALFDLEIGEGAFKYMESREVFQKVLEWNGIIGFTGDIVATVKWLWPDGVTD